MIVSVFTGKKGFGAYFVMSCCCRKRCVSNCVYCGLFLIPCSDTAGETLFVALNTPPSNTGTYLNLDAGARFDQRDHEVAQIRIRAAEIEQEFHIDRHVLFSLL